jgi:hypothetical protein
MMWRSVAAQRLIRLRVRRLFCDNEKCDARTFAEQVPGPDGAIRCGNPVLRAMLEAIGLALAGRAGARSAEVLDLPASRSTLLRLVRALPEPSDELGRGAGVDDFAL